ncbi:MAG: hypothetical protein DMG24_21160 [Acidobacteria bacterium]|nr:MAG: hypothetical protein DMG24_21160 [Acidobacteriota bacterium]
MVFSTYLGGSGDDVANGIAVDSSGNAYVVGSTTSTDFPTVNAFQAVNAGKTDTFVAKMSTPADTALRISSFTPTSGPVGTSVTINGAQYTGATEVAFNGTPATFTVVSDTKITATVPSGATVGPISVTNSSGTVTSSQAFMEVPLIASFSPTSGILGTAVTITGTSFTGATAVVFSDTPYANYCQYVQGTPSAFTVLSDTQISTSVPSGATSGRLCVTNNGFTATSSSSFTVNGAAPPTISSFSPTSGTAGTPVTITGSHFTGTTAVAFNGTAAGFSVSSDTQLTATVPTVLTATTGPITVTNSVGTGSTSTNFSATPPAPRVTGFSPANGPAGTQLTITGSGFTGTTSVTFGGIPASFTVVSDSQIAATVPGGAINSINYYDQINCIIIVTTPWGRAYVAGPEDQYGNRTFFEVLSTAPPTISSFSPTTAAVGSRITLNGANFTGAYWVSFTGGGTPSGQDGTSFAAPTGISDTQLTITVPSYAQSGPITVYNTAGSVISSASFTVTTSPPMTLSPLFATFGNQVVGTTSGAQTFTLTNNTGSAINMGGIMIGGSNSSDYSRAGTCQANSPVGRPQLHDRCNVHPHCDGHTNRDPSGELQRLQRPATCQPQRNRG